MMDRWGDTRALVALDGGGRRGEYRIYFCFNAVRGIRGFSENLGKHFLRLRSLGVDLLLVVCRIKSTAFFL